MDLRTSNYFKIRLFTVVFKKTAYVQDDEPYTDEIYKGLAGGAS